MLYVHVSNVFFNVVTITCAMLVHQIERLVLLFEYGIQMK